MSGELNGFTWQDFLVANQRLADSDVDRLWAEIRSRLVDARMNYELRIRAPWLTGEERAYFVAQSADLRVPAPDSQPAEPTDPPVVIEDEPDSPEEGEAQP